MYLQSDVCGVTSSGKMGMYTHSDIRVLITFGPTGFYAYGHEVQSNKFVYSLRYLRCH